MNILILNSNNPLLTSGIISLDIYNALKSKGHNTRLLVTTYAENYPEGVVCMENRHSHLKKRIINKFHKVFKTGKVTDTDPNYHFHELDESVTLFSTGSLLRKAAIKPDIILVLFAKKLANSKNIHQLQKRTNARVFWLMYDMAPFTGGCHYAWECSGYQNECGKCPGLRSEDPVDLSYRNLQYKKKQLDKTQLEVIAASEWQYRQALSSSLFKGKTIHKIFLPIDPEIFKPAEKTIARKKFNLTGDRKVIFFGAVDISHLRKGPDHLIKSLALLKEMVKATPLEKEILLLVAGRGVKELSGHFPFEYLDLGILDNTFGIASAYQASDLFLCPSVEDSGPSMINQSIMAGTPVVSFGMGVAMDLVINGQTGYRAVLKDSHDLAKGMLEILSLSDDEAKKYSDNCRTLGLKYSSPDVQTRHLETIFTNALNKR